MKKWFNIYLIFVLCNGCSSDKVETQTAPEISFESTNLINPLFFLKRTCLISVFRFGLIMVWLVSSTLTRFISTF